MASEALDTTVMARAAGYGVPTEPLMVWASSPERPYGGYGCRAEQRAQSAHSVGGVTNIRVVLVGLRGTTSLV